jgi:hypothetical protein
MKNNVMRKFSDAFARYQTRATGSEVKLPETTLHMCVRKKM